MEDRDQESWFPKEDLEWTPEPGPRRKKREPRPPRPPGPPSSPAAKRRRDVFFTLVALAIIAVALSFILGSVFAAPTPVGGTQGFAYGTVVNVAKNHAHATVRLDNGEKVSAQTGSGPAPGVQAALLPHYHPGDRVQLSYYKVPAGSYVFAIDDYQRGPALVWMIFAFVAVAALIGRSKAVKAAIATAAGLAIVIALELPGILHGGSPVLLALGGSGGVLVVAMYFVHGFNWKTTAALVGTLIAVLIAIGVGTLFIAMAHITNFGTEDSIYLTTTGAHVNIGGLLLAAVIVGVLGALVDITVGQASSVTELAHLGGEALPSLELYRRAMNVGYDHIGSLINTLVLAYLGTNLPTLALIVEAHGSWQYNFNLELVGVAIVQAMVGAIAIVLAVPVTTFVAAIFAKSGHLPYDPHAEGAHHHH